MSASRKHGFTIIETMLFLAISGLLSVSVLVGTGVSINRQRYRDSITSLQAVIQQQYSEVMRVNNGRDSGWSCNSTNGTIAKVSLGSGIYRGQSNCVILGRLITSSADGGSLSISDVVGVEGSGASAGDNDVAALAHYIIKISPVAEDTTPIEWGSSMVSSGGKTAVFSILVLRSPTSGIVRTFSSSNTIFTDENINSFISDVALKDPVKICVDSNGLFTGAKMAVLVQAGASSAAGVETLGELSGC